MTATVVLGAHATTIEAARGAGVDFVDIGRPSDADQHDLVVDYTRDAELDGVIDCLRRTGHIVGVVAMTEAALVPAARQRERLGLKGHGPAVSLLLRDKAAMRGAIADLPGLVSVRAAVVDREREIEEIADHVGFPAIVKPVDGAAGVGIHLVHDLSALRDVIAEACATDAIHNLKPAGSPPSGTLLVEGYIDGPEYSAEAFSFGGRHVVLGFTEKTTGERFVEVGHAFPARLPIERAEELAASIRAFLDAVGVTDGPSHTEFRLTSNGPAIIESHDRPGGDRIVDLVALATGFRMDVEAIAWAAGASEALSARPVAQRAAATVFLLEARGEVVELCGLEAVRGVPDVIDAQYLVSVGDRIGAHSGNLDRAAQIVTVGPNLARARRTALRAADMLVVRTARSGA